MNPVSGAASRPWPYPRWIAHRGGGVLAPENTLAAFECGLRHGYRAAEFDAVLSLDDVPVVLHDETLDRTTGATGLVSEWTAARLATLDAGSWFGEQFARARIPLLEEVLAFAHANGIWLNVEIKPVPGHEQRTGALVAQAVARFLASSEAMRRPGPLLSSFSAQALESARAAAPELARGMLFGAVPREWRKLLEPLDCVSLHCDHRHLEEKRVQEIKAAGLGILCYTVNEAGRARELLSWGVDAICTDRIDLLGPS